MNTEVAGTGNKLMSVRVIVVMLEPPLPNGHALGRWHHVLLQGLVARGHRVTAFVTCHSNDEVTQTVNLFPSDTYDVRCYLRPKRSGLAAKWQTLRRPYSYMFSSEMLKDISREIALGVDIVHLEGIWSGWISRQCQDRSKLVLNFHSLYDIDQQGQPIQGFSDWLHRKLRRGAEHKLLRSSGNLITLTSRLQKGVAEIVAGSSVPVVPLGIDLSLYPFTPSSSRPAIPRITMIGSMDWFPSRSAAERLLTRFWPIIKREIPSATLQIVGWNARGVLKDYLCMQDVEIIENVPNTRPFFERSAVFFYAPQRGSGMKVKIMEAFAYGVPVVTNSEGVEGLPAEDGIHAGICDDEDGLIDRAIVLLNDPVKQERQRIAARSLLERFCSPDVVLSLLESCYTHVMSVTKRMPA